MLLLLLLLRLLLLLLLLLPLFKRWRCNWRRIWAELGRPQHLQQQNRRTGREGDDEEGGGFQWVSKREAKGMHLTLDLIVLKQESQQRSREAAGGRD
jgi:hypothetical protein